MSGDFPDYPWPHLAGGYRQPFDPRPTIDQIRRDSRAPEAWRILWDELHHQGDVGEASYAAIIALSLVLADRKDRDWNLYALAATIEIARAAPDNPPVPDWLAAPYAEAWSRLFIMGLDDLAGGDDEERVNSILAVLALGKSQPTLARMALLDETERREMLNTAGWG